ncbi:MAG: peroxide stress protein YaaA [Candidatus Nanopelagicales bacterium]
MLILLPPSESKRAATRGKPLDLNALSHPALTTRREQILRALQTLCRDDPATAIEILDLGPTQFDLVVGNAQLDTAPAAAASSVYTGVLYASLDYPGLSGQDLRRANRRLAIVSALFGLVRPTDRIVAYRLSGSARLPGIGPLPTVLAGGRVRGDRDGAGCGRRHVVLAVRLDGEASGVRIDDQGLAAGRWTSSHGREPLQQGHQGGTRASAGHRHA